MPAARQPLNSPYSLTTKSGFGAVTSYSALQEAEEEQRKLPPIRLKLTLLALILAGLPPLAETEAVLASYSQVTEQVNLPAAPVTVIVPLPPLPLTLTPQGVFRAEAVHDDPLVVLQFFQVTDVISPSTGAPGPPPLVVFPLIVESVHSMVTNPDVITDFVPLTSWALIAVPFL